MTPAINHEIMIHGIALSQGWRVMREHKVRTWSRAKGWKIKRSWWPNSQIFGTYYVVVKKLELCGFFGDLYSEEYGLCGENTWFPYASEYSDGYWFRTDPEEITPYLELMGEV